MKQKLVVITGPTATGKSDAAVALAQEIGGEVISADSRQVYTGLDIGTGKITTAEMRGIPHHLLDIADPGDRYTVAQWKEAAEKAIADISARGKIPIICGGTGYYISALIDDLSFPEIEVSPAQQSTLEEEPAEALFAELAQLDPIRAESMTENGERTNRRRLARAILIARALGSVPKQSCTRSPKYDLVMIGLRLPDTELKERIHRRLVARLEAGMIKEAERLHSAGLTFERMNELGLEYRYLAEYLENKISCDQLIETLSTKIWHYARRQKTWWRKDTRIVWMSPLDFQAKKGYIFAR